MKKKNVLMMAMSLVLVAVIAVGGTLAYLTSTSDTLTNTFTVGEGYGDEGFYLDETTAKVEEVEGEQVITNPTSKDEFGLDRTRTGNTYATMSIGDTVYKDPTFHLVQGPESYIFAKVTGVDAMEDEGFVFDNWSDKWVKVNASENKDGYYYYNDTVEPNAEIDAIFTTVSLPSTLTVQPNNENFDDVVIKGVAIQAANLDTWKDAWDALQVEDNASGFLS